MNPRHQCPSKSTSDKYEQIKFFTIDWNGNQGLGKVSL